ncbi:hypothetical protein SuNHUV7_40070 (plasmid) [Pseudoseohaeicola sp. NH-UV-7]|uniref:hypothetical protein n=1 Tax=Sulfitobacter sp. TBRI5 TaxID=2989732 RepID=UPI003A6D82F1
MSAPASYTRILIGAGCFADAETAIRLADRIAASLPAELGGVLVDEGLMIDIVSLPGQRVVSSAGVLQVPPSVRQVHSLIEADAKAFRSRLSAIARTRTVKWSFEQRSGELISGLCEAAKGWDILLLGYREMHKRPGQVVVVAFASPRVEKARKLANDLACVLKADVLELCLGTGQDTGETSGPRSIAVNTERELLLQLGRINASAVVVDLAASPLRSGDQLRHLLEAARCPVFVLGAEQGFVTASHVEKPDLTDDHRPK